MIKEKKKPMSLAEKQRIAASQGVASTLGDIMEFSSTPAKPANIETVAPVAEEKKEQVSSIKEAHIQTVVENRTETVVQAEKQTETKIDGRTTRRKSGKFVDKFTFSFPEDEKLEFKAFAAAHGITITDLIMYSLDYLKQDVDQGKINISRYGVKRLG